MKNKYEMRTKTQIHVCTRIQRISPNHLTSSIFSAFFQLFNRSNTTKKNWLGHALGEGQKLGVFIYSFQPNRHFSDLIMGMGGKK